MRLSEAIRLGALLKPQAFSADGLAGKSCALRAASDALGIREYAPNGLDYGAFYTRYSYLTKEIRCPVCGERDTSLATIYTLNDIHRWTREQIADWVETIEPKEAPAVEMESSMELIEG